MLNSGTKYLSLVKHNLQCSQIHVTFGPEGESDDEDFEESSGWYGEGSLTLGKIPIVCKDRPHFPASKPGLGNAEDPLIVSLFSQNPTHQYLFPKMSNFS
jgi:hypothetical protein